MRNLQILPMIHDPASGPVYSVMSLSEELLGHGVDVKIASYDSQGQMSRPGLIHEFPRKAKPRRLGISPEMKTWVNDEISKGAFDIVHNQGLWLMANVYAGFATKKHNVPYMVSPRGSLSEWALVNRSKWIKKVFWRVMQKPSMDHAVCFHVTSEAEYEDVRRVGFKQPVALIPNGIHVPEGQLPDMRQRERRQLLFLGRIHHGKGVEELLNVWKVLADEFPDWDLRLVGPDNDGYGFRDEMIAHAKKLGLQRYTFDAGLFDEEKKQAYRDADLYVLPTYSENFGITIAEALAEGTPVVTTKGAPWSELEKREAGWWIDIGETPLLASLRQTMAMDASDLMQRGANGRDWMRESFAWERVGSMMYETYQYLIKGAAKPDWVRLD